MRLLNTRTGKFVWVEDPRREHYAILSHVWAQSGDPKYVPEQTYEDLLRLQEEARVDGTSPISKFPDKLRRFCETALKDGFELGWADTCCIDKTSSSELSEAINSMYSWYSYSGACYAFLGDVNPPSVDLQWRATLKHSRWFRRGWTLQELIASRIVIFVCNLPGQGGGWEVLGSKHSLATCISSVTGIDLEVLTFEKSVEGIPIARRMAWAQSRETSRLEDEAYCLMGIFGVSMQTNYGEGRYAFIRLQEKILLQNSDQTIFAWGRFLDKPPLTLPSISPTIPVADVPPLDVNPISTIPTVLVGDPRVTAMLPNFNLNSIAPPSFLKQYLLAPSPKDFDPSRCLSMVSLPRDVFQQRLGVPIMENLYQVFEITPYGLRTHLPLLKINSSDPHPNAATHCAILACEDPDKGLLALLLRPRGRLSGNEFFAGAIMVGSIQQLALADEPFGRDPIWDSYCRLMYITPKLLQSLRPSVGLPKSPIDVSSVYIPHFASRSAIELDRDSGIHAVLREMSERFEVVFCRWSRKVLERDGYRVSRGSSASQDIDEEKPFASSESILNRIPSFRSQNAIIISNDKSDVDLIVQVGRCSCEFGRHRGFLGVLVSSGDTDSLDAKDSSPHHPMDHPIHVRTWSFEHGSASRQIEFDTPAPKQEDSRRLSLRLTFTSVASPQVPGPTPAVRRYRLNAELREREERELPAPRQPLPLKPTSGSTRKRSKQPSKSSHSRLTAPSLRRKSPGPDEERYHIDKGQVHAVGLLALCGFLAVGLLLLNRSVAR